MKGFKLSKKLSVFLICLLMLVLTVSVSATVSNDWTNEASSIGSEPIEHKHIYGDWVVTKEPSCKEGEDGEGLRVKTCLFSAVIGGNTEVCGHTYEEILPRDPENHSDSGSEKVTKLPTCTSLGESEYTCGDCGMTYKVDIEAAAHTYDENSWVIVEPIHEKQKAGKKYNYCTVCGERVEIEIPVEHTYKPQSNYSTPATCVSLGSSVQICTVCGKSERIYTEDVDKNNHIYSGKALLIEKISCENDAKGIVRCEGCGESVVVVVPSEKAHDYIEWTFTEPVGDCKTGTKGIAKRECDVCGKTIEEIEWRGHVLDEDARTHASTCSKPGYMKGRCTICNETDAEVRLPIDADSHSWIDEVLVEPTCEEQGYKFQICKYDSSHVQYVYTDAISHEFKTPWTVTEEPSCSATGTKTNVCIKCNETIIEEVPIDPDAHPDGIKWIRVKDPTCTEEGIERAHCKMCVNDYVERSIPKHTDDLDEGEITEPTCCLEGKIVYNCTECGEDVIEILPVDPDAHNISKDYKDTKKATCSEEGLKSKVCSYCWTPIEATEGEHKQIVVPKTNHVVTAWKTTKNATCTEDGTKERTCTVCGHTETGVIKAEHRYKAWVELTEGISCTNPGTRTRGCYNCNETWTQENYYAEHVLGNWTPYKGANCKDGGVFRKYCVNCGRARVEKEVAPGQHIELIEQQTEYKVSETICSSKKFKCAVEGCEGTEVTTKHTFFKTSTEVEPTCTESGMTAGYECQVCKIRIAPTSLPATGHDFTPDDEGTKYCLNCNLYYVKGENGQLKTCSHFCHNAGTIARVMTKVFTFFWKLFGTNQKCECGELHYEIKK